MMNLTTTLEHTANSLFNDSCKNKEKDLEKARQDMAISWGFNRYLERVQFMTLCTKYLQHLGLSRNEIKNHQEYGFEVALRTIRIIEAVQAAA